jgi:hypothetical protein
MSVNWQRNLTICEALLLYLVAFTCFQIGKLAEKAEDDRLQNSGVYIDYYVRVTNWDLFGVMIWVVTTIGLIVALLRLRRVRLNGTKSLHLDG